MRVRILYLHWQAGRDGERKARAFGDADNGFRHPRAANGLTLAFSFRLKQARRHIGEVLTPERPHVAHVGHFLFGKLHALRFQPALELAVHADEAVARAAHDPQHAQFGIGFRIELGKCFREDRLVHHLRRCARAAPGACATPGTAAARPAAWHAHNIGAELNAPIQANLSRLFRPTYNDSAPPIDSPAIARCSRFLLTLYALSTVGITSSRRIFAYPVTFSGSAPACRAGRRAVAKWRDDDHRHSLPLRNQVVEDVVRGTAVHPTLRIIAQSVQQIEHGYGCERRAS